MLHLVRAAATLTRNRAIFFSEFKKQGITEIRGAKLAFSGSTVSGGSFVVELLDSLGSLRIPSHWCLYTNVAPVRGVNHTRQKSEGHQVFASMAYTRSVEGSAVARLESPAVLHDRVDDGNEACVSPQESRHDDCE